MTAEYVAALAGAVGALSIAADRLLARLIVSRRRRATEPLTAAQAESVVEETLGRLVARLEARVELSEQRADELQLDVDYWRRQALEQLYPSANRVIGPHSSWDVIDDQT